MSSAVESPPALPDYLIDPNAVLKDSAQWRYGKAPDYSNTRAVFEQTKTKNHLTPDLPSLVQNLVKNWEIEASFKTNLADWRRVDPPNYTFAINGGPPQSAEYMLEVGTYNGIIAEPNEFYSPRTSDFASSHKTFKRMMPTFAWEVLEVYSGPPQVAFRWRHWGEMKKDYVGFNDKGEKITAPAHGGAIDIQGVTVATVNDKVQLQKVETWFDPSEMFRQIAPKGIVNKQVVTSASDCAPAMENEKNLGLGSNMTQEFESRGSISGELPVHNEDSGTAAATSPQNITSIGSKHGTKREFTSEEHSAVDRTSSSDFKIQCESNTSVAHQEANQDLSNVHHEDILSSRKQSTSPPMKHTRNDQGHDLDQPSANYPTPDTSQPPTETLATTLLASPPSATHANEAQAQPSSFTAGTCPFFTGPVPFGGAAQAATDDAKQVKEETDRDGTGEKESVDQVGLGAAMASALESKETREAKEEMGTIETREREGMNME